MKALLEMYNTLHAGNLHKLREVYREDIRFLDPVHEINGIEDLIQYFRNLYTNVQLISFSFSTPKVADNCGFVQWQMAFKHKLLAGGQTILVDGATYVEMDEDGKVYYHRDYFDLGAMLYEHISLLGRLIQFIKKRLGK